MKAELIPNRSPGFALANRRTAREAPPPMSGLWPLPEERIDCASPDQSREALTPLMDYVNAQGLRCVEGWRDWYLYWEDDASPNNITLVQHVAERAGGLDA